MQVETEDLFWHSGLRQAPAQPPCVVENVVVLATQVDAVPPYSVLHALALGDGRILWQRELPYALVSGVQGVRLATEAQLVVSTSAGDLLRGEAALLALDRDGRERWRWSEGGQRLSAVATAGDTLCFTADAEQLLLLDAFSGAEQGRIELVAPATLAAPAVADGIAYVPGRGPHVLAVGLDGRRRWHFVAPGAGWLDCTPLLLDERVLTAGSDGAVLALARDDGDLLWRVVVGPRRPLSPPAVADGRLFVGARDGLYALDVASGEIVWHVATQRPFSAQPVVHQGVVYAANHDHTVYALDAATGETVWRYELARRIEQSAALATHEKRLLLLAADRGGQVVAVERPPSPSELTDEDLWETAARTYARRGQWAQAAELVAAHGAPRRAAELWEQAGAWAEAAEQYEASAAWRDAARMWAAADRPLRRAQALVGQARALADQGASDAAQAAAWQEALEAFEALGDTAEIAACKHQIAHLRRLPIITLDVEHAGLVHNAWSQLKFIVRNEGFGPARYVTIRRARGEQFTGEATRTQTIFHLQPGEERVNWLDVRPLHFGASVPLRLAVSYSDRQRIPYTQEQTVYLTVAPTPQQQTNEQRNNIFANSLRPDRLDTQQIAVDQPRERYELQRKLRVYFNMRELYELCAALRIDHEEIPRETKNDFTRELIPYLERRGRLAELIAYCQRERPNVTW